MMSSKGYFDQGQSLQQEGKFEESVISFEKAIQLDQEDTGAYYALGISLLYQGKYSEAIIKFEKLIELNPKEIQAYSALGFALISQEKYTQAVQIYQKVIELNPEDSTGYKELGNALRKLGNFKEAVINYQKALELDPKDSAGYNSLGFAQNEQGQYAEAEISYLISIELNPKFSMAHKNLGHAQYRQGKVSEAIISYQRSIELDPQNSATYFDLGHALCQQGKYKEAVVIQEKGIALNPKESSGYNYLGNTLKRQGKLTDAVTNYNKAFQMDPQNKDYIINLENAKQLIKHFQDQDQLQLKCQDLKVFNEKFELGQVIGKGQLGTVYKITNKVTKDILCCKYIPSSEQKEIEDLEKEIQILLKSNHKHSNVVQIQELFAGKDQDIFKYYIVMEQANYDMNTEIENRIQQKNPFTEDEIYQFIEQTISALDFLYKNNLAHCNIKPQNILVIQKDGQSTYKISDFNVSKPDLNNPKQNQNSLSSNSYYMSPELQKAINKESEQKISYELSDIFSLGLVVLQMATLQCSNFIKDCNIEQNKLKIKLDTVQNENMKKLIDQMLQFSPIDRAAFPNIQLLISLLKGLK